MPQISCPGPRSPRRPRGRARPSLRGQRGRLAGRARDDDGVGPVVDQPGSELLRAVDVDAMVASRNGVTIAVTTEPNLPACPVIGASPSPGRRLGGGSAAPMLAAHAAHLHEDRRRRHDGPALRGSCPQGRPGHRGVRHDRRGGGGARAGPRSLADEAASPRTCSRSSASCSSSAPTSQRTPRERAKLVAGVSLVTAT